MKPSPHVRRFSGLLYAEFFPYCCLVDFFDISYSSSMFPSLPHQIFWCKSQCYVQADCLIATLTGHRLEIIAYLERVISIMSFGIMFDILSWSLHIMLYRIFMSKFGCKPYKFWRTFATFCPKLLNQTIPAPSLSNKTSTFTTNMNLKEIHGIKVF